jgi:uncharacterized integral membrane protein (TIGR00698 family)
MIFLYIVTAMLITLPVTTPGFYRRGNLPGILFCLPIAASAWFLGRLLPLAGGAVIGILSGILIANIFRLPKLFAPGIQASSKLILQSAVVLLGFNMNFTAAARYGGRSLLLISAVIFTAFAVAFIIGKIFNVAPNKKILIGVGTAICGGSAIAAASPVIEASEDEIASSISTIVLFNIAAVFIFPVVGRLLDMDGETFGKWAGLAINDTSSVVAASYAYSDIAGDSATVVKLTRTFFILPITLALTVFRKGRVKGRPSNILPLFVVFFVLACIVNTLNIIPPDFTDFWGRLGRFYIVAAITAVGLGTNIRKLITSGRKSIFLGLCCWLSVAAVSLFLLFFLGGYV